ncbi:MAG: hypothetical protein EHM59_17465 [Betaproteobacteria bacterium]|nr:MAG: hypothetical protein EHM59_17465 [Betaproteobacteria bacterium]
MVQAADARIRAFLADTLVLWAVEGAVEPLAPPGVAAIRAADGNVVVRIERAPAGLPFRWVVRMQRGEVPAPGRPCASLVGLLNAIRRALGVEGGSPIRIAPGRS